MHPVRVRAADSDDLPALTALYNHYVKTSPATFDLAPVPLEARKQWMARYAAAGPHRLLVAAVGDAIAGYATSGKVREKPGYLPSVETSVYVHPDHQGRGVGTELYAALFALLSKEDVHRVFAAIVPPNPASVALHARFGFRSVGCFHEAGRKFDRYWDVEWFEKDDAVTTVGPVTLTVADATRQVAFYTERLGFVVHGHEGTTVRLGAGDGDLLVLVEDPSATPAPGSAGLFHFAVLVPSRPVLALSLAKLVETGTRLQGASDHLVSEALYLADPEGNGIEVYRDRPRDAWVRAGGWLKMTTDPLDVDALYAEGVEALPSWNGLPAATIIGHIHLRVAHIAPAERFYCDELGMELTTRYGDRASFVSFHGYHHHVAFNTWGGIGAPLPPPGSLGLREFALNVDSGAPRALTDPSGHVVRLTKR